MRLSRRQALAGGVTAGLWLGVGSAAGAAAKPKFGTFGVALDLMDPKAAAGDDFFRHVNGGWLETAQIPSDRARWGEFDRLREQSDTDTRAILEEAAKPGATGNGRKAGDYYASFMDEAAIEALGAAPLKPDLARIAGIDTPAKLAEALAWLTISTNASQPVNFGVRVDPKTPTRYTTGLSQGGLGLPDRDYYLIDQPSFVSARTAYRKHVAAMLGFAGFSDTEAKAARIYGLEEKLAKTHWTRVESRDADKTYNVWPTAELSTRAPGFDWAAYLKELGAATEPNQIVRQPSATIAFAALARDTPLADWRDYLAFRLIADRAPVLSKAFAEESFNFNGKTLNGTPEQPVRWKRGVARTNDAIGDAVGRLYAAKHFPPAAKAQAEKLIANVKAAMGVRIRNLKWMSAPTKAKALAKLTALRVEVGYEDKPRDYAGLQIVRGDAYGNFARAIAHESKRGMGKLGKMVDRGEWSMTAATVNAQSNSVLVKVMFPAAILQPPFFDPAADAAVNYGGIGVVIGHEISHQFDDQGSKYDAAGKLDNWWSPEDLVQFKAASAQLAAQYDAYVPIPGMHINGGLTLGENLGDLGGLNFAYDAYHASLNGKPAPVIGGYTGDQRFFMGFAQVWRELRRDEYMRQQLTTDPHSPGEFRAAMVRNIDGWYSAFGVGSGAKLYLAPDQRIKVW
ncbi:M13 family metallopeptidase [soil metagenome]